MAVPKSDQTVHMMNTYDVLKVLLKMRLKEGRTVQELKLYTTDDLRRLYQKEEKSLVKLRDATVSRVQIVAVIRWRLFWSQFYFGILMLLSVISALAATTAVLNSH